ncbi:MAG: UbiA family prenyltransferase [Deltaproteobacteria bacterium]|nr:UbiA family prenyltransferase [Deltaproteobacteria bacterium]
MPVRQAARCGPVSSPRGAAPTDFAAAERPRACAARGDALRALGWAVAASTLHRVRRGEGALLAINLSLIVWHGDALAVRGLAQALVSVFAILVMYAFNDLYDAPADRNNPKKDQALIRAWVAHRRAGVVATCGLKLATLAIAAATLGAGPTLAVAAVMTVNLVYSTRLKGVPVADVVVVWTWGSLYAAIVDASFALMVLVGVMTGICHLFQALDDRAPDAANGIATTAVRSPTLPRNVLAALTVVLFATLHGFLGPAAACTAVAPLAIYAAIADAGTGWLLTKAYFAVVWLAVLGTARAAG